MLLAATAIFLYYTAWTLLMVGLNMPFLLIPYVFHPLCYPNVICEPLLTS